MKIYPRLITDISFMNEGYQTKARITMKIIATSMASPMAFSEKCIHIGIATFITFTKS